jgi:predicted acylesterase/phospholipase RssA
VVRIWLASRSPRRVDAHQSNRQEDEDEVGAADLVLEGGGVKGAGPAGAVAALGKTYDFHRVAGTSAGAIVASFIAAARITMSCA